MKKLLLTAAIAFAAFSSVRAGADISYLLIQGGFGSGGAVETYKWKVLWESGSLDDDVFGQSLLDNVFGTAALVTPGAGPGDPSLVAAGNSNQGIAYYEYSWGRMIASITMGGVTLAASGNNGWGYYLSGGEGFVPYPAGEWTSASDGVSTRKLAHESFDGWVFGDLGYYDPEEDGFVGAQTIVATASPNDNDPIVSNFSTATPIHTVPEPGAAALLLLGAASLWGRRRR